MALRGGISLVLLGDASIKGREQLTDAGAVTLVLGQGARETDVKIIQAGRNR